MLTVLTRADSSRLTTLENVCLDLGRSMGGPEDARIERFIDQASGIVASYCKRAFGRQIYRERIHSWPRDGFALAAWPVNRVIGVSIDGGAAFTPDEYMLSDGILRLTHGGSFGGIGDGTAYNLWRSTHPGMTVDYEAGWLLPDEEVGETFTGATPLPAEIERSVIQLVSVSLSEGGRDPTVKSETVEGVGSQSFYVQGANAGLPHPGAEAALQSYRVLSLA